MKNTILSFTLLASLSTILFADLNSVASIVPEKTFVKSIGGDHIDVSVMVQPGDSPHTYEPKPSQMKDIAKSDIYFAIGVEFEHVWLPKFKDLNPALKLIDVTAGIEKIPMNAAHGHHEHHKADDHDHAVTLDPHVWTAPSNVRIIAQNIFRALSKEDPDNKNYYQKHLETFLAKIDETDKKIKEILSDVPKGTKFMVFHPSWGYFAKEYGLVQLPVEVEGKAPKPKELIALIKEAREEKVKAIFTQPEFSDRSAKIIASELGIPVIKVSPMAPNWSQNLIRIAKAIAGKE